MIGSEEQLLAEAIRDIFREGARAEAKLAHLELGDTMESVEEPMHAAALDEAGETLAFYVSAAFRHPRTPCHKSLAGVEQTPWDVHAVSPSLAEARELYRPLEALLPGGTGTALGILERVLRSTPTIVAKTGKLPTSEHQVVVPVLEYLRTCFPDVVDEGQILQIGRKLRCDIAIESLRAAIEFKFVDKKAKARSVLDGEVADVSNYGDDPRWRSYFAVVFQTSKFIEEAELREKVRRAGGRSSWTVIVAEPLVTA